MILWMRFILTIIRGILKGKNDVMASHTSTFRAYPLWDSELTYMNAARYVSFCELNINEANVRSGFFMSSFKHGFLGITCNMTTHYIKPVKIFKKFQVTTIVLGWDESFIYRKVQIHQGGKLRFEALYRIMVVVKSKKISPMDVIKMMGLNLTTSPPLPVEIELLNYRADKPHS